MLRESCWWCHTPAATRVPRTGPSPYPGALHLACGPSHGALGPMQATTTGISAITRAGRESVPVPWGSMRPLDLCIYQRHGAPSMFEVEFPATFTG